MVVPLSVSLMPRRREAKGKAFLMGYSLQLPLYNLHQLCKLVPPPTFNISGRSITSHMFVLNMVKGHHLQHWKWSPLFHDFKWLNIKAAAGDPEGNARALSHEDH